MNRKMVIFFAAAAAVLHLSSVAAAADFAYELRCEQQYQTAELPDLTWSQGSTPLIAARTYLRGKPVSPREGVTVQMMIAPTATSRWWAVVTNQTTDAASYLLQWPTVGTNTTADAPWYYTVYFLADGHRYWTGSGSLWIEETTATGDGLIWQEITSGDISWVSNRFDAVARDIAGIASDLATNAMQIAELEDAVENRLPGELDRRIDELWGEMPGGWHYPDYFTVGGVATGVPPGTVTNAATATQTVCNVVVETVESHTLKGWRIDTEVYRQADWDDEVRWVATDPPRPIPDSWASIRPDLVEADGGIVHFVPGTTDEDIPATNPIVKNVKLWLRGTLGDYCVETVLDYDAAKQSRASTVHRFAGPAPGSLLEAGWNTVLVAASNGAAQGKDIHMWTGTTDGHWPYDHAVPRDNGWNPDFWAAGLGNFECVSFWTDGSKGYRPVTLATPRHGIVANHWKPPVGSNVYWMTRSGEIRTNQVVAYKNIRGDLTVARLEHAFDTNDIAPAKLLAAGWHGYLYGDTNATAGLVGVPVVGFDCLERGYVMNWNPTALWQGRTPGARDDGSFSLWQLPTAADPWPYYRREAVGGDSGSPVFWPIDGTNTVLLGCFLSPQGGPLPEKSEVDAAIAEWGDEERCEEYSLANGGWPNPDIPAPPVGAQ